MSPILFEALLYLKKNMRFWTIATVAKAMRVKEEDLEQEMEMDDDTFYED